MFSWATCCQVPTSLAADTDAGDVQLFAGRRLPLAPQHVPRHNRHGGGRGGQPLATRKRAGRRRVWRRGDAFHGKPREGGMPSGLAGLRGNNFPIVLWGLAVQRDQTFHGFPSDRAVPGFGPFSQGGQSMIAVSGYGQAEDRQRSREAGFDHHLVKPADSRALLAILHHIQPRDA